MTPDQALYYLQDESYPFQCLEDELAEIETSGDICGTSKRAKEIYALMDKMITDFQKTSQWPLF
jgi:ribosomal protein L17